MTGGRDMPTQAGQQILPQRVLPAQHIHDREPATFEIQVDATDLSAVLSQADNSLLNNRTTRGCSSARTVMLSCTGAAESSDGGGSL